MINIVTAKDMKIKQIFAIFAKALASYIALTAKTLVEFGRLLNKRGHAFGPKSEVLTAWFQLSKNGRWFSNSKLKLK